MDAELEQRLRELLDKQDIREAILKHCRACDRQDKALMASNFHDDAVFDHYQFEGKGGGIAISEAIMSATSPMADLMAQIHFVPNTLVEIEGDVAYSETYGLTCCVMRQKDGADATYFRSVRLLDRWERRDGKSWKIAYRTVRNDGFERYDLITHNRGVPDEFSGLRSMEDGLYKLRELSDPARRRAS